jgi:hypothetical protein
VILSVSGTGRVSELRLLYRYAYRITDDKGRDLVPPGSVELFRDLTYDDSNVLAKQQEESLLWRDMESDLVQLLMRRLAAAKPVFIAVCRVELAMQLRGEQLAAHLERELRPVYLVYGDEPLLVIEAADAIRAAARRRGFDEREVLTVTAGFNWNELYHAAGSLSLFGGRTLIDLRMPTGKPGRDGSAAIQEYCARPSPDSLLLVSMNDVDWREEKSAWMNALATAGVVVKLLPPTLAELPAWLAGRLRRQQQGATLTACASSPSGSRAICSRRIRKSSSSASSIRSAR